MQLITTFFTLAALASQGLAAPNPNPGANELKFTVTTGDTPTRTVEFAKRGGPWAQYRIWADANRSGPMATVWTFDPTKKAGWMTDNDMKNRVSSWQVDIGHCQMQATDGRWGPVRGPGSWGNLSPEFNDKMSGIWCWA